MNQPIDHGLAQSARAAAALKAYDENEGWYRALPEAEQDGRNYEHYEDTILTVVHELAETLRAQLAGGSVATAPSPAAPVERSAVEHTEGCHTCGVWVCADCGARRQYASRFSALPQTCGRCSSADGQMLAARHRPGRAEDHRDGFDKAVAAGLALRYPLGS